MNAFDGYPASDGIFYFNSRTRLGEITDGTSNTLLLGETLPDQNYFQDDYSGNSQKVDHWTIGSGELGDYPSVIPIGSAEVSECLGSTACPLNSIKREDSPMNDKELSFASAHSGGVNLSFADGHIRFVSDSIDPQVLMAIGTRAGHEKDQLEE
jgi:prepilin-type processing-associated H-X9-DG protein